MGIVKLRTISEEEAFDAICFLQTFEPNTERERFDIDIAIIALRKVIKQRQYYEAHREEQNKKYRQNMQDPEFRKRKQEKDKRYRESHREQILEKNRRYAREHYSKVDK